jgi:TolB protein
MKAEASCLIIPLVTTLLFLFIACPASQAQAPLASKTRSNNLVFSSEKEGNQEIYQLDLAAGRSINLSQSGADDGYPRCSPDGRKIAFATNRDGYWEIYLMDQEGNGQRNLTKNRDGNGYMDWSPDGQSLVFASTRNGQTKNELYIIRADGTGLKRLTNHPAEDVHPAWSPDGKKIAFASDRDGNRQVYVMDTNGTNITRLMSNRWYDDYPGWSPDGSQIVFSSDRDSRTSERLDIYVAKADGSEVRRITSNPADDRHPAWSPDGSQLAFASNRDGNRDIFVMNADGTQVKKVYSSVGNDEHPRWCNEKSSLIEPTKVQDQFSVKTSNLPAFSAVLVNGSPLGQFSGNEKAFSNEERVIDITHLMNPGINELRFVVKESRYAFEVYKNKTELLFADQCGYEPNPIHKTTCVDQHVLDRTVKIASEMSTGVFIVPVSSGSGWVDAGIDLRLGQKLTFIAWGFVETLRKPQRVLGVDVRSYQGPNGETTVCTASNCIIRGVGYGTLVGRIGPGKPFRIGANLETTASATGRLFLTVNNTGSPYSGKFFVRIEMMK